MERENSSLFKHAFQRKKKLVPKKTVTMKPAVLIQGRKVVNALGI